MPQLLFRLLVSLFFLPLGIQLAEATQVQEVVLDNGLKVLLLEDHKSPAVTFQVWYRVGGRNEKDGKSGLAHFLEHMMFKGTPTTKPEEYSRIIAKNGGRSNAFTSSDVTVYFATMSREKIAIELELEADRMANALLGDTYFEPEKKVIQEERRLRTEDNPASALSEVASAVAFTIHPYRRPVVGWMQDILKLTRQDLVDFYKLYYAPNNAYIVVVGDFSSEEILAKIKAAFGKIPRGAEPPAVRAEERAQLPALSRAGLSEAVGARRRRRLQRCVDRSHGFFDFRATSSRHRARQRGARDRPPVGESEIQIDQRARIAKGQESNRSGVCFRARLYLRAGDEDRLLRSCRRLAPDGQLFGRHSQSDSGGYSARGKTIP